VAGHLFRGSDSAVRLEAAHTVAVAVGPGGPGNGPKRCFDVDIALGQVIQGQSDKDVDQS